MAIPPRRTRIVATIGPASSSPAMLRSLIRAGMNVARLNFSHGTVEEHARVAADVRREADGLGRAVAVLQDLQGPRIRIGPVPDGEIRLRRGQRVRLRLDGNGGDGAPGSGRNGDPLELRVALGHLLAKARKGSRVLLKDGTVELRVDAAGASGLECTVQRGGAVTSRAGINAPGIPLDVAALTARDRKHLEAGVAMGVDAVALSFVRDGSDMQAARRLLRRRGSKALVVAKIERAEALENLDDILAAADGVIVARGDLGVECSLERVPLLQKAIIRHAVAAGVFVITATQMLESMTRNPTPTRAEVSDVANAVLDGSDGVMLSAETASGDFPERAVAAMDKVARGVENEAQSPVARLTIRSGGKFDFAVPVAGSALALAQQAHAAAIVAFTVSGRTATILASLRPRAPIYAFTTTEEVRRQLAFHRGIRSRLLGMADSLNAMFEQGIASLVDAGWVKKGDVLVLVGGHGVVHGSANALKIHRV